MTRLRQMLRSDEAGFTIVELLLVCALGLVILGSATLITIGATRHNNEVSNRTDATQRGRLAMERMQRLIRSQVCTTASITPITDARKNSLTLTADLSDGSRPVERHTFTFDAPKRTLTDSAVLAAGDPINFAGSARAQTLATDVEADGTTPVFRYWAYPQPTPPTGVLEPSVELVPSGTGTLAAAQLQRIARIDINFLTTGATNSTRNIRAQQTNQVFVRLANPDALVTNPTCG